MGKVINFEQLQVNRTHKRKEAKVRKIRESFQAARQSWQDETRTTSSLKKLLQRQKTKREK